MGTSTPMLVEYNSRASWIGAEKKRTEECYMSLWGFGWDWSVMLWHWVSFDGCTVGTRKLLLGAWATGSNHACWAPPIVRNPVPKYADFDSTPSVFMLVLCLFVGKQNETK